MDREPKVSKHWEFHHDTKIGYVYTVASSNSIVFQYICLNCLPRKEYFVGFGRLRAHLRAHHRQQWLNQDDSNRYRSDCGYMLEKKHYFPGDPDYEAWRAVGYGAPKVARPQQNEGPAEAARGINITPEQFTAMMSAIMGEVNKNVATGVNNTINSAASMLSLMSTSTKQETHARRCFPVPHTHNVLVAINNPAANPSPASKSSSYFSSFSIQQLLYYSVNAWIQLRIWGRRRTWEKLLYIRIRVGYVWISQ